MTRDEFLDSIGNYEELIDFCNENDISLGNVMDEDDYSRSMDADIEDAIAYETWEHIRDCLNECPDYSSTGWYRRNGRFDYDNLNDSDFDSDLDYALGVACERGIVFEETDEEREAREAAEAAEAERQRLEAERRQREAEEQMCARLADFLDEEMIA